MRPSLFTLFLLVVCSVNAQKLTIAERLKAADSVLLISHDITSYTTNIILTDSTGKRIKQPDLVAKGKLNEKVVKERRLLLPDEIARLSKILAYKYKPLTVVTSSGCFDPHHAIIIIKKGKTSFIDLCFHCSNYITSPQIWDVEIRDDKMEKLYAFFKQHGFTYEMNLESQN